MAYTPKMEAPENTLSSVRRTKLVCTWVEVDVMLTKDKVPVIHYDNTLKLCTNDQGNFFFSLCGCVSMKSVCWIRSGKYIEVEQSAQIPICVHYLRRIANPPPVVIASLTWLQYVDRVSHHSIEQQPG